MLIIIFYSLIKDKYCIYFPCIISLQAYSNSTLSILMINCSTIIMWLTIKSLWWHSVVYGRRNSGVLLLKLLKGLSVNLVFLVRICHQTSKLAVHLQCSVQHEARAPLPTQLLQCLCFIDDVFGGSLHAAAGVLVHVVGDHLPPVQLQHSSVSVRGLLPDPNPQVPKYFRVNV